MFNKLIVLSIIILINTGCAGVQISKDTLSKIKTINIDSNISTPDDIFVQGKIDPISSILYGGIGAGMSSIMASTSASEQVQKFMEINNIKINEIVLNEYKKELLKTGRFKLSSPGDATLKIVINTYGFGNSDALSDNNKRKPLLNVKASLIQNNRIIWEKQEYVTNFSDLTTPYDMNDLAQKPDLLKKSFSQAANIVASQAFSQLLAN
ncbi:MAG TPA: hypothetical protein ENJ08_04780 [Gammaproteobacteria bacterium]|nr:hypothetical protein [Gammaproteobacteria bacterium]